MFSKSPIKNRILPNALEIQNYRIRNSLNEQWPNLCVLIHTANISFSKQKKETNERCVKKAPPICTRLIQPWSNWLKLKTNRFSFFSLLLFDKQTVSRLSRTRPTKIMEISMQKILTALYYLNFIGGFLTSSTMKWWFTFSSSQQIHGLKSKNWMRQLKMARNLNVDRKMPSEAFEKRINRCCLKISIS